MMPRSMKTSLIAIAAVAGLAGCQTLSEQDRALLNRASTDAAEARQMAQKASQSAAEAARAAESAQRAAEQAAQTANEAAERAERMFNESLRK